LGCGISFGLAAQVIINKVKPALPEALQMSGQNIPETRSNKPLRRRPLSVSGMLCPLLCLNIFVLISHVSSYDTPTLSCVSRFFYYELAVYFVSSAKFLNSFTLFPN
jgi:hypothetical protein